MTAILRPRCIKCERTFNNVRARDQHEKDAHKLDFSKTGQRRPDNDDTPPPRTHTSTTPSEPRSRSISAKESYVVDFFSPKADCACAKCGTMGAIPLTRRCPSCDPLLIAMSLTSALKAQEEAERAARLEAAREHGRHHSAGTGTPPALYHGDSGYPMTPALKEYYESLDQRGSMYDF